MKKFNVKVGMEYEVEAEDAKDAVEIIKEKLRDESPTPDDLHYETKET